MKPKQTTGYTPEATELCERTLVTLLRGLGPWRDGIYLVGGLVPRYLLRGSEDAERRHAGTHDVDLVLDVTFLGEVEAYRRLEKNLQALGFVRGRNARGQAQHFRWCKRIGPGQDVIVDLLCDASQEEGGQVMALPGERRLSALKLPGAHLAVKDHVTAEVTAELLDGRGQATMTVRVAGLVAFVVLKALAYEERFEEKDAYDLIYTLDEYGVEAAASAFRGFRDRHPEDTALLEAALAVMRRRFASEADIEGWKKDGPTSYARFQAPLAAGKEHALAVDAADVVETFLSDVG